MTNKKTKTKTLRAIYSDLFLTYCESQIMTMRILRASQRVTWTVERVDAR